MRPRRIVAAGLTIATVVALLSGCGSSQAAESGAGFVAGDGSLVVLPESQRSLAPDFTAKTLDGGTFRLADHRGEVVVVNVWASWCAPCRAEAPVLAKAATDLTGKGVQFVGLDTRDSDTSARAYVQKFGLTYPNVIDRDGQVQLLFADSLPPQAIPSTVVIDRQGRVAARALGTVSESAVRGMVEPLLAEKAT
ncbi:MAG: TlpA disulfide reductase family protein [Actinomycetes bacterium]